jgi:hypothetical protein
MRNTLALTGLVLALVFVSSPAAAVDYQGRLLDGHTLPATIYGPIGTEPAVVFFQRDEARVLMLDGDLVVVDLYKQSIEDTHFVTGKSSGGDFYRIDLADGPWQYARSSTDLFFMPVNTFQTPAVSPVMSRGGARRGGGN